MIVEKVYSSEELMKHDNWAAMDEGHEDVASTESSLESSENSIGWPSSSLLSDSVEDDDGDDTSSSSSRFSQSNGDGAVFELSELMNELPIKRGLSKFYKGKSQSYTSLATVKSIEDLAKKENFYTTSSRMKSCKSYARGLDAHTKSHAPKATISKKASRSSLLSSSMRKRSSFSYRSIAKTTREQPC